MIKRGGFLQQVASCASALFLWGGVSGYPSLAPPPYGHFLGLFHLRLK